MSIKKILFSVMLLGAYILIIGGLVNYVLSFFESPDQMVGEAAASISNAWSSQDYGQAMVVSGLIFLILSLSLSKFVVRSNDNNMA